MKTTTESFNKYIAENPQVYEEFKRLTLVAIHRGRKKLGAQQICEVIRWNSFINYKDEYKVNNSFVPGLSRKFEKDFPQFEGIFNKRKCNIEV